MVGYVAGQSKEVISKRTATSSTYTNSDGTQTLIESTAPIHYQTKSGAWENIDTTLRSDPSTAGGLMSGANSWVAHFAPLGSGGGVTITSAHGTVRFNPLGAAKVTPQISPSNPSMVVYPNAWPGVNVEYVVSSSEVEEHIILTSGNATDWFAFSTPGVTFAPAAKGGGLQAKSNPSLGSLAAPTVVNKSGDPLSGSGVTLAAEPGGVGVGVGDSWLQRMPVSAFPIDIDPTLSRRSAATYRVELRPADDGKCYIG